MKSKKKNRDPADWAVRWVESEKWLRRTIKEVYYELIKKTDTLNMFIEYMIEKEKQDERWQALTEDGRQARIASYQELLKLQKEESNSYLITIEDLEKLYGKHNLNPDPPTPKTWEDVEKEGYKIFDDYRGEDVTDLHSDYRELGNYCDCICLQGFNYDFDKEKPDNKIILKAIASLKIAKLIELGYGGMVSKEEWRNSWIKKYCVERKDNELIYANYETIYCFIAFHTYEQREEFMSYESNRQLVEQYNMM